MDEGDNLTCLCGAEGGNPPPNVTWYKNGEQIGEARDGKNILNLTDVTEKDNGTYTCVVQSYTLKDKKSIEVIVYCKYYYLIKIRYQHIFVSCKELYYIVFAWVFVK